MGLIMKVPNERTILIEDLVRYRMSGISVRDVVFLIRARKHTASGIWLLYTLIHLPLPSASRQARRGIACSNTCFHLAPNPSHLISLHDLPALSRTKQSPLHIQLLAARSLKSHGPLNWLLKTDVITWSGNGPFVGTGVDPATPTRDVGIDSMVY